MYRYYLKPSYELTQFLPQNYQISFEYKNDRFTFPALQQKKILNNPMLGGIYEDLQKTLATELNRLPQTGQEVLKKARRAIVFWQDNLNYGLIVELNDQDSAKMAAETDFSPWQSQLFKKQVLLLASTRELLAQMIGQKIQAGKPAYLSLTIAPWLTIKLQQSFFSGEYDDAFLSSIQTVLSPLKNSNHAGYRLEVDSDPYTLIARLLPQSQSAATSSLDLKDYFAYLPQNSQLIIGLTDFQEIPEQLAKNPNFKKIWSELDGKLWLGKQISLSNLLKNAQLPVILSWSADNWQITTTVKNQSLAEYYLKNFLGQFEPKEKNKILPDGSRAVELLAAPEKIIWQASQQNGWKTLTYPKNENFKDLGLAIKGEVMLIGNRIGQTSDRGLTINCSLVTKSWEQQPVKTLFWLNPQVSWLKLTQNINKFTKVLFSEFLNGEINMCLGLP